MLCTVGQEENAVNVRCEQSDGTPIDLSGSSALVQVRPKLGSETVLIEFSTDDGSMVLGGCWNFSSILQRR